MSDVLTEKVVKTRKPHICFGCGRQFPEDTEMTYQTVADGGTVNTFYICGTCREVMSHMDYWDEFRYGELREDALELESERGVKPCESTRLTPKPTNYERIIRKTPEELAEFLAEYRCVHKAPHCMETNCAQCWLDWLKQEESDG